MSEPVPILVPQEVVNDTTVRIVHLHLTHGQQVAAGAGVAELETSKSSIQVEAPAAGWVMLLCKVGDDVPVGGVIGRIYDSPESLDTALQPAVPPASTTPTTAQGTTVFSEAARAKMQALGLNESVFTGRAFVRALDVDAMLRDEIAPSPVAPKRVTDVGEFVMQQTLADGWPLMDLIRSDLHRIDGHSDFRELLRQWFWNPGFSYVLWFRIAQWARQNGGAKLLIYPIALLALQRRHLQSGIRIPISIKAGPGLLIAHWGSIWINPGSTLGANCTLGNDINMGSAGGAGKKGVPHLGDNVYVGPGARIAGPIKIGHNVAIMPNTLVTSDVPPGGIAIGVPHTISGHLDKNIFVSHTNYSCP